jgi:hypothetical protein
MAIKPFKNLPKDMVEWARFFQSTEVIPDPDSVDDDAIQDRAVTYPKIQNVTPNTLLGRDVSPAGQVQEIVVTGGLEFTGSGGIQRSALTGDVTANAGSSVTAFRDATATSILGRAAGTDGPLADIVANADDRILLRRSGSVSFTTLVDADIPASIARDSETTAAITALNLASGNYTPTLTSVANLDATTAYSCQYLRVGSVVTVSGRLDANPTAAGTTTIGISLPVASNLANANECAGAAFSSEVAGQGAAIFGDSTNDRALMQWVAVDISDRPMFFTFSYRII